MYREEGITALDSDSAVNRYLAAGIPASNLSLGVPLYGRSFENTNGLGQPFNGVGPGGPRPGGGTPEAGVWLYNQLPRANATRRYDAVAQAAYTYDGGSRELISHDDNRSVSFKAGYVAARGLAGAFFFEARGDRDAGSGGSLIAAARNAFALRLDNSTNLLRYPTSQYDNIRSGAAF